MTILICFAITLQIFVWIIIIRNNAVFHFRQKLLKATNQIARHDIAIKFLDELMKVSYNDMVWQWWKPCKSFYSKDILKLLE